MRTIFFLLTSSALLCCTPKKTVTAQETLPLIPKPQQMELLAGNFMLNENTRIYTEETFEIASDFLLNYLQQGAGIGGKTDVKKEANILFEKNASIAEEGYVLLISEAAITIRAADAAGAFYGVQTLRQLLPPALERINSMPNQSLSLPCLKISDAPQFSYRGMHLDVGRHFFPKEFIKDYIAAMALLKMNYFHWHLTEDQGWRIEILQYPKLTKHGGYRNETLIGHYNDTPQQFDGERYGGFYTQEDIKEVVAFATAHNVTIIPEIEMPGHAQAAISAYPELGCTGKPVPVATKWGVFTNIYCPNQDTFTFLKNVLTEVMTLFPGDYIHIGGDEAPKAQWKDCSHCQQLIKDHNLKDEVGLQSYFIKEIESFVNSQGKKIIGWDEILEGGLAPNATVMSWRGTQGAVEAAKEGHDVVLTPTSHAYFDYYQADHSDEPLAIGGFLPLQKVYSFNPVPKELNEAESKFVLGAQGNVWTEYMKTTDQVEYMAFPRMLAMSEVVWRGASDSLATDYPDFLLRLEHFTKRLNVLDINYANHLYDLEGAVIKKDGAIFYELTTPIVDKKITYSMNLSSEEKTYESPIPINTHTQLTAAVVLDDGTEGRPFQASINYHKGITGTVSLNVAPHPAYGAGGKEALINGISGSDDRFGDKEWLGFWGDDLEITIELGKETEVSKISTRFYDANGQWVYVPKSVIVAISLSDGRRLTTIMEMKSANENIVQAELLYFGKETSVKALKIELRIPSYGTIPEGLQGAGNKAWTFIDEIIIE